MTKFTAAAILKAFGRMIDQGDPEAHKVEFSKSVQLAIYDAPFGPVIALFGSTTDDVAVILSVGDVDFMEEGVIKSYEPDFVEMTPEDEAHIRKA